MKYRAIKKSILRNLQTDMDVGRKYLKLRSLFAKQFDKVTPIVVRTNKEKLVDALPTILKVYLDDESRSLFMELVKNGNFDKTQDFIKFLEKIAK